MGSYSADMRRGSGWIAGLGAAVLLLVAWVSTADYLAPLRGSNGNADPPHTDPDKVPGPPGQGSAVQTEPAKPVKVPLIMDIFFMVLLVVFALILIYILWRRVQRAREARRRLLEANDAADAPDDLPDDLLPEQLQRSAERGIARLAEGDPRNAIVRCWVMLEDTVAEAGLPPDPALTSEELTSAVLARYAVTPAVIDELARLYREARFSEHTLDESHRKRAVAALNALRNDLDAARSPA